MPEPFQFFFFYRSARCGATVPVRRSHRGEGTFKNHIRKPDGCYYRISQSNNCKYHGSYAHCFVTTATKSVLIKGTIIIRMTFAFLNYWHDDVIVAICKKRFYYCACVCVIGSCRRRFRFARFWSYIKTGTKGVMCLRDYVMH